MAAPHDVPTSFELPSPTDLVAADSADLLSDPPPTDDTADVLDEPVPLGWEADPADAVDQVIEIGYDDGHDEAEEPA